MKVFTTKDISDILDTPIRTVRHKVQHANSHDVEYITIKSNTFYFRKKPQGMGKGYEFCEVPFSELSVFSPSDSSLKDIYISEVQKDNQIKDINIASEVKLAKLSILQQQQINFKELFVLEYKKNISNIITKLEIPVFIKQFCLVHERELEVTGLKLNKTNLRRWRKAYDESGKYGLMKSSGNTKGKSYKIPSWVKEELESKFFALRGNITPKNLYDLINAKASDEKLITKEEYIKTHSEIGGIVSYGTVKNLVRELKGTAKFKYLINPDKYKNNSLPAFGDMRAKATHANHYWEIDSTQLDAFGKDENGESTWQLISISDIHTAMKVITVAKTSNSNAIAELLYKSFIKLGIPEHIITDNGKDYLSNHAKGLFKSFGINHIRTEPFAGEQKPFVERHFGSIQNSFTELLNGFKGHDVAGFKAIQSQVAKSERLLGKAPDTKTEFIDVIAEKLDDWIDNVYSRKLNRSLGFTPYDVYIKDEAFIKRVDVKKIAYIFGKAVEVNIAKKGIRLNNKLYNNMHGLLGDRVGTKALLTLDFVDTNIGYLFDLNGVFITLVTDEKISIHGALQAKKLYKNQIKAFEKEWGVIKEQHKDDDNTKIIIDAHKKAYADARPIESIGGDAITQNSKIIDGLVTTGQSINEQIDAINTINSEPNLALHEKALERSQVKPKKRAAMTYDELLLGKQVEA